MTGKEAYRRPAPTLDGTMASSNHQARQQVAPASLTGFRLKTARGALITSSLPMLQNLIKRSSDSYAEEFLVQWGRFGSLVEIAKVGLGGKGDEEGLREVTGFVCQVRQISPSDSDSTIVEQEREIDIFFRNDRSLISTPQSRTLYPPCSRIYSFRPLQPLPPLPPLPHQSNQRKEQPLLSESTGEECN